MLRLVAWLFLIIIGITVMRALIGWMAKGFTKLAGGDAATTGARKQNPVHSGAGGHLVKDPVCGVYISTTKSIRLAQGGETLHFCSAECRSRYLEAGSRAGA